MKKKILILGASGSIGQQAIEIIKENADLQLVAVSVYENTAFLKDLLQQFPSITHAYCKDNSLLINLFPHVTFVDDLVKLTIDSTYDIALNALVGKSGLLPSLSILSQNKKLALANKETLVIGGELIKDKMDLIIPVDSEHSAIYMCLLGEDKSKIEKIVITCSGGAVRELSKEQASSLSVSDILKHPTWQMGKKITTDCATLVNKAFEIIEAHYLFSLPQEKIDVLYHPQSIVHGMIYFTDGTIKAVLSSPDMRLPISYALCQERRTLPSRPQLQTLTFKPKEQFEYRLPLLNLGYQAILHKGTYGAMLTAVNDTAVAAFIDGKINFGQLCNIIIQTVEYYQETEATLESVVDTLNKYQRIVLTQLEDLYGNN